MENALFARIAQEQRSDLTPAAALVEAWIDPAKGLQRIALYANRIQRAVEKNTTRLEALQSQRKAAYEKAQEEAVLLTQLAQSKGETYDPAPDFPATTSPAGFVYARDEIARLISRRGRLEEAKVGAFAAAGQAA